jgi:hypothetical protein
LLAQLLAWRQLRYPQAKFARLKVDRQCDDHLSAFGIDGLDGKLCVA